jgi:hypothetical protein
MQILIFSDIIIAGPAQSLVHAAQNSANNRGNFEEGSRLVRC